MIETICKDCGARYQVGTDHVCPKKRAAKKSAGPLIKGRGVAQVVERGRKEGDASVNSEVAGSTPVPGQSDLAPTKFDKKAWMRDYMRDYRKKHPKKAKGK